MDRVDVTALLERVRGDGIELWTEGGRLRFRAPPDALTDDHKAALRAHRADVIDALREEAAATVEHGPIAANQLGMWLLQMAAPESAAYNFGFAARVLGPLDESALRSAVQVVVDRHEALRTHYHLDRDGQPERIVAGYVDATVEFEHAADATDDVCQEIVRGHHERPFDLGRAPLLRVHVVQREPEERVLVISAHHLAVDGQSMFVLLQELFEVYGALAGSRPMPGARAEADFSEFIAWQNDEIIPSTDLRQYWEQVLEPAPLPLDLGYDRPRDERSNLRGGTVRFEVSAEVAEPLRKIAATHSVTEYVTLLAAWSAYLSRISGSSDVTVGTPVHGRPSKRFEFTVGDFVNVVPLRIDVGLDRSFEDQLTLVGEVVRDALAHQHFPFPLVAARLAGAAGGGPFESMFAFQDFKRHGDIERLMLGAVDEVTIGALRLAPWMLAQQEGQFPLTLDVWRRGGGWFCTCKYDSDLFDPASAALRAEEFQVFLQSIAAEPGRPLGDVPLLPEAERRSLDDWNDTERANPWVGGLAHLVETTAQRDGGRVAIRSGSGTWTYDELHHNANRVAAALVAGGVKPGDRVAVLMDRTPAMIAGLLGILRVGAAYVPVDPGYPPSRVLYVLDHSRAAAVLTRGDLARDLEHAAPVVDYDALPDAGPTDLVDVDPDDTAYVIYTSGSTGNPKGVVIPHRAVTNFLRAMAERPGFGPDDVLLAVTTISFDISVLELFLPLTVGGCVVLADEGEVQDPVALSDMLSAEGVTVMQATPATWKMLLRSGWTGARIRALCGGESLPLALASELRRVVEELWNMYGPTETTVWSTVARIDLDAPVTIGRPISNTRVYILDRDGRRQPVGVPGELWIGGAGVASSYYDNPELTAAAFRESPFRTDETIYRTGDLARIRPDGELEHLGRIDDQLKIRGFRIEPGEVEHRLRLHPQVLDAAVVADDERLVAFVIESSPTSSHDLTDWVRQDLPGYMVPSICISLDALPLTPNGKVDRGALRVTARKHRGSPSDSSPLETQTEIEVARIWQRVLNVGEVGRNANFFELGGHSLTATEVVARLRDLSGLDYPIRTFFDAPTVRDIAAWVDDHRDSAEQAHPIEALGATTAPLSFSQERMWFLQQLDPLATAYNVSGGARLRGNIDAQRFVQAVDAVGLRQESLRTRFETISGRPKQVIDPVPGRLVVQEDLSGVRPEDRLQTAIARMTELLNRPYDLETGPLTRFVLLRLGDDDHVLGVGMHHVVSDLWSFGILGREIATLYNERGDLPDLPITYSDYSVWQRDWLLDGPFDRQLEYWRGHLSGIRALDLPTDYPRPKMFGFEGAALRLPLPHEVSTAIARLATEQHATPFMVYLAAFNVLLWSYARSADLPVGVPIANRTRTEVEHLVGTFVNTLVHRNDLSGNPTASELVERVRNTALDAFDNQDIPFELLVKELAPERDTSRPPLVQVLFNVGNVRFDSSELDGVEREIIQPRVEAAQFELTMNVGLNELQSELELRYNTGLFEPATAQRFLDHYLEILHRIAEDPRRRLGQLAAPASDDRQLLLREWNETHTTLPFVSVPHALAEAAARQPDKVAVRHRDQSWSYAQLLERAQRVSARLGEMGIGPGDRVLILLDRSPDLLSALVGVMGAGAAYVPVDPEYPEARIRYVIDSSNASAAVTSSGVDLGYDVGLPVLEVDALGDTEGAPFCTVGPEDPAYAIYTSGSTGKPKGVEIPHRAVVNFLATMADRPGLGPDDILFAVTTISFDIAVLELYLPLLVGATVVIADSDDTLDAVRLASRLEEESITIMQATPATWKLLVRSGWEGKDDLRILCGGEPLPPSLAEDLLARSQEVWNMYGPTETTVWSTVDEVRPNEPVLIGRPIANTTVYVLDESLDLVPRGVPGELWIGGEGVALGYVGRPDLTAERFVSNPHVEGERIYRTGDLVRYRPDGRLEHLGRLDHQVKVRGFRIELGEVEATLRRHEEIPDAVVVARDDQLVAYLIETLDPPTVSELRNWVGESLPSYMVPSHFVFLESFPQTPNGKVDRAQLPEPGGATVDERSFKPPESEVEEAIAEVWGRLLGVERVGRSDNFFEIGGHSLLAMEAVSMLEERLGHRLEPRSLFFRSLEQLAATIEAAGVGQPTE